MNKVRGLHSLCNGNPKDATFNGVLNFTENVIICFGQDVNTCFNFTELSVQTKLPTGCERVAAF